MLPSSSIQTQNGQSFVQILKNGEPQLIPVEIGLYSDTQTEIVTGLSQENIVVVGNASLLNNDSSPFSSSPFRMMRMAR